MHILFVAAENGALPGGKVGGIGDVIRDLPLALSARGCRVTVVTPSHGFLHRIDGAVRTGACRFLFRGTLQTAGIYKAAPPGSSPGVTHLVIHHPVLSAFDSDAGRHAVYMHDPPDRPFFNDGSRFALFGAAVAAAVSDKTVGPFDVLHLHDWHAAQVALLGKYHPNYAAVGKIHTVFSIHNLAFQGVRPLRGSDSSLEAWFPELRYDWAAVADPRWPDCVNPMAVGIRLADRVNTVSAAYAEEIRQPSRKPQYYGGEGLESDLEIVHRKGRLTGILNGCFYPAQRHQQPIGFKDLLNLIQKEVIRWSGSVDAVPSAHFIAFARSSQANLLPADPPDILLTAVGRVGEQKMLLLRQAGGNGRSGLHQILDDITGTGCFILLGNGDREYERFFRTAAAHHDNFIFLNGFSESCARALYTAGDLFLMPSSFEPCGLSQMLAMRAGQPCVVHAVGGLKDTVADGRNGFVFGGDSIEQQVDNFVQTTLKAVGVKRDDPAAWEKIRKNAAAARFTWDSAAERYIEELYSH